MNSEDLLNALLGSSSEFEAALREVESSDEPDLLIGVVRGLQNNTGLDNAERERRLSVLFRRLPLCPSSLNRIAQEGATLSNAILRNALSQLLPPEFRALVFRRLKPSTSVEVPASAPNVSEAVSSEETITELVVPSGDTAFSDVLILSVDETPATKKLLGENGFVPLRCKSVEELDKMLASNEEICGFIIETSFLNSIDSGEQNTLIEKLACFSSFAWLRFQTEKLISSEVAVGQQIARARCRVSQAEVTDVSFKDAVSLQERELEFLKHSRSRLSEGEGHGLFLPGELGSLELRLLGAAMSLYCKKRRFNPGAELTQVKTKFLQGGQTGARVALVTFRRKMTFSDRL